MKLGASPSQNIVFPRLGYAACLSDLDQSMRSTENFNTDISIASEVFISSLRIFIKTSCMHEGISNLKCL